MTEKPKTIYKDGLRWNLLPKEAYGKEVYVPCNTPYHYLSLGIKSKCDVGCLKINNLSLNI